MAYMLASASQSVTDSQVILKEGHIAKCIYRKGKSTSNVESRLRCWKVQRVSKLWSQLLVSFSLSLFLSARRRSSFFPCPMSFCIHWHNIYRTTQGNILICRDWGRIFQSNVFPILLLLLLLLLLLWCSGSREAISKPFQRVRSLLPAVCPFALSVCVCVFERQTERQKNK